MGKGISGFSYLPPLEIQLGDFSPCSTESIKSALQHVARLQAEGLVDGTYNEKLTMNTPYSTCDWGLIVQQGNVAGDVVLVSVAEDTQSTDAIGRAALTTRRKVDVGTTVNGNEFTVRSLLAAINFIDKLEDEVAETGSDVSTDATYTDILLSGPTPYKQYKWTIVKLGIVYTLVPTTES